MNFCGIICEFNPFHNGHEYIIEAAKRETGEEVICLMSGDFVQRGEPAICNKHTRAKIAIECGASAVIELPTIYACSNAENFAYGAVKTLGAIGVDTIVCGVENIDIGVIEKIANLKVENSKEFVNCFKNEIENGITYNTALKRSIANCIDEEDIWDALLKPNNILAVEYLTAIKKLNLSIKLHVINRCDNGYYSGKNIGKFLSATEIRNRIYDGQNYENFVPKNAKSVKFFDKNAIKTLKTQQLLKIRQMSPQQLSIHYDYNDGIEYRIKKLSDTVHDLDELEGLVSNRRYRAARVKKLLLYPTLNITKDIIKISKTTKPVARLLAIRKNFKNFLSMYKKSKINIVVTNGDYELLSKKQKSIMDIDFNASQIYRTISGDEKSDKKIGTIFL